MLCCTVYICTMLSPFSLTMHHQSRKCVDGFRTSYSRLCGAYTLSTPAVRCHPLSTPSSLRRRTAPPRRRKAPQTLQGVLHGGDRQAIGKKSATSHTCSVATWLFLVLRRVVVGLLPPITLQLHTTLSKSCDISRKLVSSSTTT
jgi:hypothetical protein